MKNTEQAWKEWGEMDPYFGVLSEPRFRKGQLEQHRGAFFDSGEVLIAERMLYIERLYGAVPQGAAVDFGCGVGRLMLPLSRRYEEVIGIDISPAMLEEARKNLATAGVDHRALFCERPSELAGLQRRIDLVSSSIVLQHIPPAIGMGIIRELLQALAPGGVAALHVTLERRLPPLKEAIYQIKHRMPGARYLFNLLQGKRWNTPLMQMNDYPLAEVLAIFQEEQMQHLFMEPVFDSSLGVVIYGRKMHSPQG